MKTDYVTPITPNTHCPCAVPDIKVLPTTGIEVLPTLIFIACLIAVSVIFLLIDRRNKRRNHGR